MGLIKCFYDTLDAIKVKTEQVNQVAQALKENNFNYQKIDQSAFGAGAVGFDFNYDVLKEQLNYLEAINGATEGEIANWQYLTEQQIISVEQCENIANAVHEAIGQTENLVGQTEYLEEKTRQVEQAIFDAMFPIDSDVDSSALQILTQTIQELAPAAQELADSLESDARAAENVAEAILRFDDAVVDVVDHYQEWKAALNSGSIQEQAEAIIGLRDAYADLLNLDGDSLSNQFLTNAENLQLMNAAIDGSIDAYDQLQFLAAQDIL